MHFPDSDTSMPGTSGHALIQVNLPHLQFA